MSNDDGDSISKLVVLVLGIAAIGFFAYLIFKDRGYQIGGGSQQQMSLADDGLFQMDRRLHQMEDRLSDSLSRNVKSVKTLQHEVQRQERPGPSSEYLQTPDAPSVPRKVVSMNSRQVQEPNIHNLSKADQDKVRRLFFNML